jgi:hypothetical protein
MFHCLNPSGRTVTLGWTYPLTEMSTRVKVAGGLGLHPYNLHLLTVSKFWESQRPGALKVWPVRWGVGGLLSLTRNVGVVHAGDVCFL